MAQVPKVLQHFPQVIGHQTDDLSLFYRQALRWAATFDTVCQLDSGTNLGPAPQKAWPYLLAVGSTRLLEVPAQKNDALAQLAHWLRPNVWTFMALSYELKHEIEPILPPNTNPTLLPWPLLVAYEPEYLLITEGETVYIAGPNPQQALKEILTQASAPSQAQLPAPAPRQSKESYIKAIENLQEHILAGDIYEANYCQAFQLPSQALPPAHELYLRLQARASAPHAAYWQHQNLQLCCISPERYLCKVGNQLYSQPIKGTAARHPHPLADAKRVNALLHSEKDRAEHIMIVDLVRNDLARVCKAGSVHVPALIQHYRFARVHQLISTVVGEIAPEIRFTDILQSSFPMGSMTGAPKIKAMQLIDRYEQQQRGIYSGSVGYIAPDGNFDFNVVIRSWLLSQQQSAAAIMVGGAIVYDSMPEAEYQECLTKTQGLMH